MGKGTKIDFQNERQKSWITILLLFSCIAATMLLWKSEPPEPVKLETTAQIDSLISITLADFQFPAAHVRQKTIPVDSVFSRKVYTLRVAPEFSKTTFHYYLQQTVWPYNIKTLAFVEFPEENMTIHLMLNNTVHRSFQVISDPEIPFIHQTNFTPPDNEMD